MIQPFQDLIGRTVVCVAADVEKKGISFALADGTWMHFLFPDLIKLSHINNVANLANGEILGVQAITQMVADVNTVECIVNFDIRDQPESIIRFEINLDDLVRKKEATDWISFDVENPYGPLIPLKEDF